MGCGGGVDTAACLNCGGDVCSCGRIEERLWMCQGGLAGEMLFYHLAIGWEMVDTAWFS